MEDAKKQIAEALEMHLELMRESGEEMPVPSQKIEFAVREEDGEAFCTWVEIDVPVLQS